MKNVCDSIHIDGRCEPFCLSDVPGRRGLEDCPQETGAGQGRSGWGGGTGIQQSSHPGHRTDDKDHDSCQARVGFIYVFNQCVWDFGVIQSSTNHHRLVGQTVFKMAPAFILVAFF